MVLRTIQIVNAYKSYFNGFTELLSSKSSAQKKGIAALKILSIATVIIPLGFLLAYAFCSSKLKGRVKVEKKPKDHLPKPVSTVSSSPKPAMTPLQESIDQAYSAIRLYLEHSKDPYQAQHTQSFKGVPIKFGMTMAESVYIETFTSSNTPVHFYLLPGGGGKIIYEHWNKGFSPDAKSRLLQTSDLSLLNWAMPIIIQKASSLIQSSQASDTSAPITATSSPFQEKLKGIHEKIVGLLEKSPNPFLAQHTSSKAGVAIKFGMSPNKSVYIETYDNLKRPVHITLYPEGDGVWIDEHWKMGYSSAAIQRSLTPEDLKLLEWAMPIIEKKASAPEMEPEDFFEALSIPTPIIRGKDQEVDVGGYNWKTMYAKSELLKTFAQNADEAILAYRGVFSNYQIVPFKDPMTGLSTPSGEHLFHMYKFPPETKERKIIHSCKTPDQARQKAGELTRDIFKKKISGKTLGELWGEVNKELMVYIQLAKALEPKTKLSQALIQSGNSFIIEDTSKRKNGKNQETRWGDNGDGTGENKLGWAQMSARIYIGVKGLNEKSVQDYFQKYVQPKLEGYYKLFP